MISSSQSLSPSDRESSRPLRAIVLSGGGMLGAYQVGAIDAVAAAGMEPDLLVGTSVGALNAAFWACFPGGDVGGRLLRLWEAGIVRRGLLDRLRRLGLGRSRQLLDGASIRRFITGVVPRGQRIEQARIPLAVTATDLGTGDRVVLREGDLVDAVMASASMPGTSSPVRIGSRLLVDGGIVANADLETALEAGAREVLVVDLTGPMAPHAPSGLWETLDRIVSVAMRRQTDLTLALLRGRARVEVLRPQLTSLPRLGDFSQTRRLFEQGRRDALALLARRRHASGGPASPETPSPDDSPRGRSADLAGQP